MRAGLFLLWLGVLLALLLPFLRRRLARPRPGRLPADELVKDPVCQTYVVRSRAVRSMGEDGPRYFCSAECARRYTTGA